MSNQPLVGRTARTARHGDQALLLLKKKIATPMHPQIREEVRMS